MLTVVIHLRLKLDHLRSQLLRILGQAVHKRTSLAKLRHLVHQGAASTGQPIQHTAKIGLSSRLATVSTELRRVDPCLTQPGLESAQLCLKLSHDGLIRCRRPARPLIAQASHKTEIENKK